jgi:hypothetical protein
MVLKVDSDMFAKAIIPVSAGNIIIIIIIIIPVLGTER